MTGKVRQIDVKKEKAATPPAVESRGMHPFLGLRDEIDRVFDRFFGEGWMPFAPRMRRTWEMAPWRGVAELLSTPPADFAESEKEYELTVELPGLDEKQIEVTVGEEMITVVGEREDQRETRDKEYHLTERSYGSVRRAFRLPPGADAGKAKATFAKGVLTVRLPKTEAARTKPHKIEVKAA